MVNYEQHAPCGRVAAHRKDGGVYRKHKCRPEDTVFGRQAARNALQDLANRTGMAVTGKVGRETIRVQPSGHEDGGKGQ